MLKGIKKKWTDITIALALPLVIWNGATGIYNQWEEVQDEIRTNEYRVKKGLLEIPFAKNHAKKEKEKKKKK